MATSTGARGRSRKNGQSEERKTKKGVRSIYIPDDLWRKARIEGATKDMTISAIIRDELEDRYARQERAAGKRESVAT